MAVPPGGALRFGVAAGGAVLAWGTMLAGVPAGVAWLCGSDGLVASITPWEASRLAALTAMWCLMMAAMVVPCMLLRRVLDGSHPARPQTRVVPVLALLVLTTALAHWSLESTRVIGTSEVTALLLVGLVSIELRKWAGRATIVLPAMQMAALQLLVDPMSVGWMAVVTAWMLVDVMLDRQAVAARWSVILHSWRHSRRPQVPSARSC